MLTKEQKALLSWLHHIGLKEFEETARSCFEGIGELRLKLCRVERMLIERDEAYVMLEDKAIELVTQALYTHDDWMRDEGYEALQRKELKAAIDAAKAIIGKERGS